MLYIYILTLKNNKYYVGKTNDIDNRLSQHFNGYGSEWTKKHSPIDVFDVIENCDDFDEDKYTKMLMHDFGIDNVRGGSYSSINLSREIYSVLEKEINMTTNKCLKCGKNGHFAKDCFTNKKNKNYKRYKNVCFRCGRESHYANNCYAVKDINGHYIN